MQEYIKNVVEDIRSSKSDYANISIILPSKRASVFVKNEFKSQLKSIQFLPRIVSIEDFINEVSGIETVDNLVLLFEFYKIYLEQNKNEDIDTFEEFSKWANILIKDFNEIDSYLINQANIFGYLKDINRIENWFSENQLKTELTKKHIHFFEKIEFYYKEFYQSLLKKSIGYQGLQYREAFNNIENFIHKNKEQHYIFIGFNALNTSEERIIKSLLDHNLASVYFDIDKTILDYGISANRFINKYRKNWRYFKNNPFKQITTNFQKPKNIYVIGIPKNVSQIKYAGELLEKKSVINSDIALVLANENLLTPTINSLPNSIEHINITMGLPLKNILYADLFNLVFKLYVNKSKIGNNIKFYYKDVLSVLNHSSLKSKLNSNSLQTKINTANSIFISVKQLISLNEDHKDLPLINAIFNVDIISITNCIKIILLLKQDNKNHFEIEYLQRFEQVFNQIETLNKQYGYINSLESFSSIFSHILNSESLSFKGDALQGVQIMGMLETRVLEFDTVIITSVNEGFLPSGKTNNSFIPFDIKREKGIPTYQEKDAIFSYHFFRLLARANNVFLLYNTETDDFGSGEKSRFITQLTMLKDKLPNLNIKEFIVSPKIANEQTLLKEINKNDDIIKSLFQSNKKGFSPTSLTNYIYNPIAFYQQKILKIYKFDQLEETIAANTLGTVIHKVLERFYLPFINKFLKVEDILLMKKNINDTVRLLFTEEFKNGDIKKGKNLLIFEVSKQFIINFLNKEIALLKQHRKLKIIALEANLTTIINIDGIETPIKLIGQADRIDQLDGILRIIDYKTGKVEQSSLNLVTRNKNYWDLIAKEHKFSKAFQVMMYAYMYAKMYDISFENTAIESGVISFKNLKAGFMKVNKTTISGKDMLLFEAELKNLLSNIFNIKEAFIENENLPY